MTHATTGCATLLPALILGLSFSAAPALAQNTNTTSQTGKVNINITSQCDDSNVNSTYQDGKVNINKTRQGGCNNKGQEMRQAQKPKSNNRGGKHKR